MLRPFTCIVLSLSVLNVFAAPTPEHELQSRADKPSQSQIDAANGQFPGIDWSYTATEGQCDSGQFAILFEATRMAIEMMKFTGSDLRMAYDTTGFNRYFMRHTDWFKLRIFDFASGKYFGVFTQPTSIPKKNRRQYKTAYWCGDPPFMSNHCDVDYKPPAYTIDTFPDRIPSGSRDPTYPRSNSIVFCEKFFKQRYVNDITATPGRQLLDIDTLVSYEHMIIHEWFHNRDTDVASLHIEDIKGDYGDGERTIYGSYATQHYAWRHVLKGGGIGDLEYKSMMNADSYAWMITYNWYKSIYNWNDDGSMQPLKKRDEDPEETTNPYEDMPTTDFVDGDSLPEIENISMPELSTYNPPDCPNCLVTDGGCIANVECRYANDTGVVDDVCTHCTCDVSKTDNSNSTEDLSLTDPKCFGYTGTLPVGYHWSATTAGVPGPTATGGAKFLMPRAEVMDEIWADTQALYD